MKENRGPWALVAGVALVAVVAIARGAVRRLWRGRRPRRGDE